MVLWNSFKNDPQMEHQYLLYFEHESSLYLNFTFQTHSVDVL